MNYSQMQGCGLIQACSPRRLGLGRANAVHLAVEQTVNDEDEGSLQAVDDSEEVGHDTRHGSNLEEA